MSLNKIQEAIGKNFFYVNFGGFSNNYGVGVGTVTSVEVKDTGVTYYDGSKDYSVSGGKGGEKLFLDLKEAKEHASKLNTRRYERNEEHIKETSINLKEKLTLIKNDY